MAGRLRYALAAAGGAVITGALALSYVPAGADPGTVYGCVQAGGQRQIVKVGSSAPSCAPTTNPIAWPGTITTPSPASSSPSPSPTGTSPSPTATSASPSPATGGAGQVLLTGTQLAMDDAGAVLHDGNPVDVQPSDPSARSQQWQVQDQGSYVLIHPQSDPAMCLDEIVSSGQVDIWGCGGGANQQWMPQPDGTLKIATDNPGVLTAGAAGTQLTVAAAGGQGQAWTLPSGTPSPSPTPTSLACPGGTWAWTTTDPNGLHDFPPYTLYNNSWNGGEAGPQDMCANSAADWAVTSTQPDLASDPGSVKTYPEVQSNYPDQPLSGFSTLTSTYAEQMPTSLARLDAEAAYDIWLGNTSVATTEIMFWTENAGQSPGGTLAASGVPIGGHAWDIWCGGGTGPAGCTGGTYFVFALHGITPGSYSGSPSGTVDLLAGIKYLIAQGDFAADAQHLMRQVNFGWEICSTGSQPGLFRVTSYSVTSS